MKQSGSNPKVLAALGILVIAAVYMLLVKPQGGELTDLRDKAVVTQQNLDNALSVLAQTRAAAPEGDAAADEVAIGLAVPASPEIAQLLRHLQTIAAEAGVTYATVTPTLPGPNPAGPGGSMSLSITASGTTESINTYLARVRDLERLVIIEQVSTVASSEEAAESQLQLSVRVFTTAGVSTPPA